MKKLYAALATFTALTASALAADLPQRAPPIPAAVPVFTWTGGYVGINLGFGFSTSDNNNRVRGFAQGIPAGSPAVLGPSGVLTPYPALFPNGSTLTYGRYDREGFSGGGQVGYNYQLTPGRGIVLGIEADAQYLDFGNRPRFTTNAAAINPGFLPINGTLSTLDFLGTVRGRLGYAMDRVMFYATGGFAYATGTNDGTRFGFQNFAGRRDDFKTGYAVGGGFEYAVPTDSVLYALNFFQSSAITVKVEALYVSLDRDPTRLPLVGAAAISGGFYPVYSTATNGRNTNDFAVVRAGMNYKFGSF